MPPNPLAKQNKNGDWMRAAIWIDSISYAIARYKHWHWHQLLFDAYTQMSKCSFWILLQTVFFSVLPFRLTGPIWRQHFHCERQFIYFFVALFLLTIASHKMQMIFLSRLINLKKCIFTAYPVLLRFRNIDRRTGVSSASFGAVMFQSFISIFRSQLNFNKIWIFFGTFLHRKKNNRNSFFFFSLWNSVATLYHFSYKQILINQLDVRLLKKTVDSTILKQMRKIGNA